MKRYTEDQIQYANERIGIIGSMLETLEDLKCDAKECGIVQIMDMLDDIRNQLNYEYEELDEIVTAGYRQEIDDAWREYRLAVI